MDEKDLLRSRVLAFHEYVLKVTGGASGIRDEGALDAALSRPFATFGGEDLYSDIYAKSAALIESLIMNHPFVDGNKRTGIMAGVALLSSNNIELTALEDVRYEFVIEVASGHLDFENIIAWLRQNTQKI